MNVEALDGFFAALIAGPETVMPSEYYREVFGGGMSDTCEFGSVDEANDILGLMMRHRSTIVATLHMRPKPISPEQREDIFVHMAAGLLGAYQYFQSYRQISIHMSEPRRRATKGLTKNDLVLLNSALAGSFPTLPPLPISL